ncbi:MAG: hypothetical protein IPP32_17125 [Bacteroidetes bacterium]|nr:hypothetical protein [Bacteroidota bacterium]
MKKIIRLSFLAILASITLFSCKKDDNSNSGATANVTNQVIQSGKWAVTFFSEDGVDHTNYFSNYLFEFSNSGVVSATKNTNTVSGTWQTGTDDSQVKFILLFNSISPFEDIEEDWHVLEQSSSQLKLEHISGGNGGTKYLTFAKQ